MGNFVAEALLGIFFFITIWMILLISCKIIEIIWLCLFNCFSPYLCPRRHREPWPLELCNCIIYSCIFMTNCFSICCINIKERLKKYKENINKKKKVKPIIYDDVHIIVINPYEKYQIATVSEDIN